MTRHRTVKDQYLIFNAPLWEELRRKTFVYNILPTQKAPCLASRRNQELGSSEGFYRLEGEITRKHYTRREVSVQRKTQHAAKQTQG